MEVHIAWAITPTIFVVILLLGHWVLSVYYRVKYVSGTRNKFKRQIQEILENHKIDDIVAEEELAELLSGEKLFINHKER